MPRNGDVDIDTAVDSTPTRWWSGVQQCWTTENPNLETDPPRGLTVEMLERAREVLEENRIDPPVFTHNEDVTLRTTNFDMADVVRYQSISVPRGRSTARTNPSSVYIPREKGLHHECLELPNRHGYRIKMIYNDTTLIEEDVDSIEGIDAEINDLYNYFKDEKGKPTPPRRGM